MWKSILSALVIVIILDSAFAKDLPSYLKVCKRKGDLRKCLRENVKLLQPRFKTGIPELFIPSLDPLKISEATLNSGNNFKAKFKDIELYHADEFDLKNFDINLDNPHVNVEISFPKLRIISVYNINGRLLVLNLDGKGPADGNYTNVHCNLSLKGTILKKHNKDYVRWEKEKIKIDIEKIHLSFEKIFGENKELNDQTNKVINANINSIVEDLQPVIQQVVGDIIYGLINRLFARFSLDELFPQS